MNEKNKSQSNECIEVKPIKDEPMKIIPYELAEGVEEIKRVNCKLCQSEYREQAEEMLLGQRKTNYNKILSWLKERGVDISYAAVRNHMISHFKATEKKMLLKEYSIEIQKWMNVQPNKIQSLKKKIAVMEREIAMISIEGDDISLQEKRKNAEIIKKLSDTLLAYEVKLEEYQQGMEPVGMLMQKLKVIVKDELEKESTTESAKKAISTILSKLQLATEELQVG